MYLKCLCNVFGNRTVCQQVEVVRLYFIAGKKPVALQPVFCNTTDFAAGTVLENQTGRGKRTRDNLVNFGDGSKGIPGKCQCRLHRVSAGKLANGLQIAAGATVATVAGFQKEKGSKKCQSEKFLPIFHCVDVFIDLERRIALNFSKNGNPLGLLLQFLCHRPELRQKYDNRGRAVK